MSEDDELNKHLETNFEEINALEYVHNWFDEHPEPYNIDCHWFEPIETEQIQSVHVYFADQIFNNFMIKITCKNARKAEWLSRLLYKTTCQMGITQILKYKELFLFTDTRF